MQGLFHLHPFYTTHTDTHVHTHSLRILTVAVASTLGTLFAGVPFNMLPDLLKCYFLNEDHPECSQYPLLLTMFL